MGIRSVSGTIYWEYWMDIMDDETLIMLGLALIATRRRKKRRFWVHPINMKRNSLGKYNQLVRELRLDSDRFYVYFRMSPDLFDDLLSKVGPLLVKRGNNFRETLSPAQRLAITLM